MVMVSYSMGQREVLPGMHWRDLMTGSTWEVVEPTGGRMYSPSGFDGTLNFWCRCVEWTPEAQRWKEQARDDGCIVFCGDSIASMLLPALADRPCTCHPDDSPPTPCAKQYALTECIESKANGTT